MVLRLNKYIIINIIIYVTYYMYIQVIQDNSSFGIYLKCVK